MELGFTDRKGVCILERESDNALRVQKELKIQQYIESLSFPDHLKDVAKRIIGALFIDNAKFNASARRDGRTMKVYFHNITNLSMEVITFILTQERLNGASVWGTNSVRTIEDGKTFTPFVFQCDFDMSPSNSSLSAIHKETMIEVASVILGTPLAERTIPLLKIFNELREERRAGLEEEIEILQKTIPLDYDALRRKTKSSQFVSVIENFISELLLDVGEGGVTMKVCPEIKFNCYGKDVVALLKNPPTFSCVHLASMVHKHPTLVKFVKYNTVMNEENEYVSHGVLSLVFRNSHWKEDEIKSGATKVLKKKPSRYSPYS